MTESPHPDEQERQERRFISSYLESTSVRKLQLGCGGLLLPDWLNTDNFHHPGLVFLDARRPFPFADETFDYVFFEHMIEHLTYEEGLTCLRECWRVLKANGRLRIATPALERIAGLSTAEKTEEQERYIRWAIEQFFPEADKPLESFVINNFFHAWGHQFIYDRATLRHALEQERFVNVTDCAVGASSDPQLSGLERHGLVIGEEFNRFETIVLEATRPPIHATSASGFGGASTT